MRDFLLLFLATENAVNAVVDVFKGIRYAEKVERWKAPVEYKAGFDDAKENRLNEYGYCPQENFK